MPFRYLSPKIQDRLSSASLIIPWSCFAIGTILSISIARSRYLGERENRVEQMRTMAQDYSKSLELELINSSIRLQFIHEVVGGAELNKYHLFEQILKNTVFQRVSVFRVAKTPGPDTLPVLTRIYRSHASHDTLIKPDSPYLSSIYIRRKIAKMAALNIQNAFTISHTGETSTLNLIWRYNKRRKEVFVFSTPLSTLTSAWPKSADLKANLFDIDTGLSLSLSQGKAKLSEVPSQSSTLISKASLINVGGPLRLEWNFDRATSPSSSVVWILLVSGLFITGILSMFLRFVLDQNRYIASLVVKRTHELESAVHEAREANMAKTRFLANMSHELRTPLNLILGMLELLDYKVTDKKLTDFIKSTRIAGDHLLTLINDLLSMSREEPLEIELKEVAIKMPTFIEEIGRIVGPECAKNKLKFNLHISPDLPHVILGDPARLRQILMNLLRNSIKYTREGSITLKVDFSEASDLVQHKTSIRFQVSDTGVGIPKNKINRIFDRFFQIEGSKLFSDGGVGLGLAIVNDLVSRMKGQIDVHSDEGVGSTFSVDIAFKVTSTRPWFEQHKAAGTSNLRLCIASESESFFHDIAATFPKHGVECVHVSQAKEVPPAGSDPNGTRWIIDGESVAFQVCDFAPESVIIGTSKTKGEHSPFRQLSLVESSPLLPSQLLSALGFAQQDRRPRANSLSDGENLIGDQAPDISKINSILVVDDDAGNRELLRAYFSDLPWKIYFAQNGQEALESYRSMQPDLVIADLRMPIMDGFELTDELRKFEAKEGLQHTPVILVTADALEETSREAAKHSVSMLLTKPIRKTRLMGAIQQVMRLA